MFSFLSYIIREHLELAIVIFPRISKYFRQFLKFNFFTFPAFLLVPKKRRLFNFQECQKLTARIVIAYTLHVELSIWLKNVWNQLFWKVFLFWIFCWRFVKFHFSDFHPFGPEISWSVQLQRVLVIACPLVGTYNLHFTLCTWLSTFVISYFDKFTYSESFSTSCEITGFTFSAFVLVPKNRDLFNFHES